MRPRSSHAADYTDSPPGYNWSRNRSPRTREHGKYGTLDISLSLLSLARADGSNIFVGSLRLKPREREFQKVRKGLKVMEVVFFNEIGFKELSVVFFL